MFARLTFISVQPESIEELKRIYNEEVAPVVKSQKGNIGVWLLEPTDSADDFISLTECKPVLKTYNLAETKVAVTM